MTVNPAMAHPIPMPAFALVERPLCPGRLVDDGSAAVEAAVALADADDVDDVVVALLEV